MAVSIAMRARDDRPTLENRRLHRLLSLGSRMENLLLLLISAHGSHLAGISSNRWGVLGKVVVEMMEE